MRASCLQSGLIAAAVATAALRPADAEICFTIMFEDPQGVLEPIRAGVESNLMAAADLWASHMTGSAELEIVIRPAAVPRTTGRSVTSSLVALRNGFRVFEPGAIGEIRSGIDPNGSAPDIEIHLGLPHAIETLWYDPDPIARTTPVPLDRIDAVTTFQHELGHAFGFNGWRDHFDGSLPADYMSTFDELTVFDGENFSFVGQSASSMYGGPVPLTFGNIRHLGNSSPRPGEDLVPLLMNGVVFYYGRRYSIDELEISLLRDAGVPIRMICIADRNSDESVDIFDLLDFLDAWFARDQSAETTGDEPASVDIFDLLAFLDLWFTECG